MITKSGKSLFPIGIGTWGIGGTFKSDPTAKYNGAEPSSENEEVEIEAIQYSIAKGQNHIDCAELYGAFHTDEVVGRAIDGQSREDLYIADKLWKTSVGKGLVRPTVEKMLSKLRTDYLDMLYIHAPWEDAEWEEAIPQIDDLIDEGVVRSFAVSNFRIEDMKLAQYKARHPIAANQMNYNVLHQTEIDEEFKEFCLEHGIAIIAYQPIKRGEVFENGIVKQIASNHNASAMQVALAWLLQQDMFPIPKATNKEHIDENLASIDIELTTEDIAMLNNLG